MGRREKKEEDKKVKFTISLDPKIYELLKNGNDKKSRIIEKILREHYDKKDLL